jgi:hypothetical protein
MFLAMWVSTGVLSAIVTYGVFLVLTPLILRFVKRRRSLLFHPESIAQSEWENAVLNATIERATSRPAIRQALCEHGQTPAFFRARAEQLRAMGHSNLLPKLERVSLLREVLRIYAREDWSDLSKIIAVVSLLSGRSKANRTRPH